MLRIGSFVLLVSGLLACGHRPQFEVTEGVVAACLDGAEIASFLEVETAKVPLILAAWRDPGVLVRSRSYEPFIVQITHFLSEPLDLGDREAARRDPRVLASLHKQIWGECQAFLSAAVKRRSRYSDRVDRVIRSAERQLQRFGL